MYGKSLILALSFLLVPAVAMAGGRKEEDLAKALAKYEKTGNVERCIQASRIRTSRVIDDYNILFIMKGKKAYLNTMKHRCSRLGFEKSFSYELHVNQLCNIDIITVFDSTGGIQGPSCGLEKFVEYKKKPKEDKKE
ncbi:MAG: hypothetical protein COA81_06405 [Alphaproteobacteria bacterium]|nr:MAG: hypothetical protein COA81_06405 [Alphaproteobacteria bacterium]